MTATLLIDKSRLQEIYDLRVTAYENSTKSIYVNRKSYPNGWYDHLDEKKETLHWIVEEEKKIIASARLAILNDINETGEGFDKFELPLDRPFAYWSRLIVHPLFRKSSAMMMLDNTRIKYLQNNEQIKFAISCITEERRAPLLRLGFKYLGDFMFNWEGKGEQKIGAYILVNNKVEVNGK